MADGQLVASGRFTSDGASKLIALRSDFDIFRVINKTQAATTQGTGRGVVYEWRRGFADGEGLMYTKQDSTNALDLEFLTTGGFTRKNTGNQTPEAAKATSGTDVDNTDPAVVTVTSHGYSNGDRVLIYGTTGMLQIAGMEFTIGSVATNDFELSYLDASGFAADATAGFVRRLPNYPGWVPYKNYITGITAANPAVVTLSLTHNLAVGDKVRFFVSADNGMSQMNGLVGEVTAVNTSTNTISVDIDSSAFTAFTFPTSAVAAGGYTPAHIVPFGTVANGVDQALVNQAQLVMVLGAGADGPAGSSADVMYWEALKSAYTLDEV